MHDWINGFTAEIPALLSIWKHGILFVRDATNRKIRRQSATTGSVEEVKRRLRYRQVVAALLPFNICSLNAGCPPQSMT